MKEPSVVHSFVQINRSFVHLAQYGAQNSSQGIVRSPNSTFNSTNTATNTTATSITNESNSISWLTASDQLSVGTGSPSGSPQLADGVRRFSRNHSSSTLAGKSQKIVLFIPGNPGLLGVYHDFLTSLYRVLAGSSSPDQQLTLLAISHNNFDHPDHVDYRAEERICVEENDLNFVERSIAKNYIDKPHHIELQVLNKLFIIKRLLKVDIEDCRIVFVGHSIGCYVILRLLQDRLVASAHDGSIMLHPALENLALTEKGLVCARLFNYRLDYVVRLIALMLDKLLPNPTKLALTKKFCSEEFVKKSSQIALESVAQLACQRTLNALLEMAKSELALVKDLNSDLLIKPHASKMKLIYAIKDHWVNPENRRILSEKYPELHIEEQPTMHAFVMDPKTVMDYAVKVGIHIEDFYSSDAISD